MSKTCCPDCKSSDDLSVIFKTIFALEWSDLHSKYVLGCTKFDPSLEDNNKVVCGCGWVGRFYNLKPATEKYRVVLIMDVDMGNRDDPVGTWDWKEMIGMDAHESVIVDGVSKL